MMTYLACGTAEGGNVAGIIALTGIGAGLVLLGTGVVILALKWGKF